MNDYNRTTGGMVQLDVPQGGWIKIRCAGGCITIYKVRYHCCLHGLEPIAAQLSIANRLCKGKQSCDILNFGKMISLNDKII